MKLGSSSSARRRPAKLSEATTRPPWASAIARTIARPEARPAGGAVAGCVGAVEAVEHALALRGGYPGPVVLYDEAHPPTPGGFRAARDPDAPAPPRDPTLP